MFKIIGVEEEIVARANVEGDIIPFEMITVFKSGLTRDEASNIKSKLKKQYSYLALNIIGQDEFDSAKLDYYKSIKKVA